MADSILTVPHLDRKTLARIFSQISVSEAGCWLWGGHLSAGGYAQTTIASLDRIPVLIHRVLFAWAFGPIPRGRGRMIPQLDHFACDTRRCVNPSHLRLVSIRENVLRGNSFSGVNNRKTHCPQGHPYTPESALGSGRSGRYCIPCHVERFRDYSSANPEKVRATNRAYYARNAEARRAAAREAYARRRDLRSRLVTPAGHGPEPIE